MSTQSGVRKSRTWDLILSIILLILLLIVSAVAAFAAVGLAFAGDSCGASSVCDYDRIAEGFMAGIVAPLVVGFVALVVTVVMLILRRLAFWIPLVGIVLAIAAEVAAWAWAISGVVPIS
jgi:hypothetical protein